MPRISSTILRLEIDRLCADLSVNIPNRKLDDDGNVLVRFKVERGIIYASQVSNGDENDLNIRVYGTKKSIEWHQEEPNLLVKDAAAPRQVWRRGNGYITGAASKPEYHLATQKASSRHLRMSTMLPRLPFQTRLR